MGVNLVLVHGFKSGPETWQPLTEALRGIEKVRKSVTTFNFEYSSPKLGLSPVDQIPALQEIAELLATFLGTLPESRRNSPTILVGHSQGGLVIQSMIAKLLAAGDARMLLHIAHCVLIATPTNGSAFLLRTRGILARLLGERNPQEKRLRPLDDYIGALQRTIAQSVVYSSAATDHELPVPFTVLYGVSDAIVQPQSARWVFPDTEALPGNHFTVIRPEATTSPLCVVLERLITNARSHLPPDASLVRTVAVTPDNPSLLQDCLNLHATEFTPSQSVRKDDAEYWLAQYEQTFQIRLRMIVGQVDGRSRAFLMFHEDQNRNLAVIDYLVSRGQGDLDNLAVKKLLARLRDTLGRVGVQYVVFEVARPLKGSLTFDRDRARIRLFEKNGGRIIPDLDYCAPSMDGAFDPAGEEPSLLMVGSPGAPPASITWSAVRDIVGYLYGTWYRNWFSHRHAGSLDTMDKYLNDLRSRVLAGVPTSGRVALTST